MIKNTSLKTFTSGMYSFMNSPSFELLGNSLFIHSFIHSSKDLPNLESLTIGDDSFLSLPQLYIFDLPTLTSLHIGSKSCTSCLLTIRANPSLQTIFIGQQSFSKGILKLSQGIFLKSLEISSHSLHILFTFSSHSLQISSNPLKSLEIFSNLTQ